MATRVFTVQDLQLEDETLKRELQQIEDEMVQRELQQIEDEMLQRELQRMEDELFQRELPRMKEELLKRELQQIEDEKLQRELQRMEDELFQRELPRMEEELLKRELQQIEDEKLQRELQRMEDEMFQRKEPGMDYEMVQREPRRIENEMFQRKELGMDYEIVQRELPRMEDEMVKRELPQMEEEILKREVQKEIEQTLGQHHPVWSVVQNVFDWCRERVNWFLREKLARLPIVGHWASRIAATVTEMTFTVVTTVLKYLRVVLSRPGIWKKIHEAALVAWEANENKGLLAQTYAYGKKMSAYFLEIFKQCLERAIEAKGFQLSEQEKIEISDILEDALDFKNFSGEKKDN